LATGDFSLSAYASQFLKCPCELKGQLALHRVHFMLGMSLDDFDLGKISQHLVAAQQILWRCRVYLRIAAWSPKLMSYQQRISVSATRNLTRSGLHVPVS
jgi:hypothetical protein